MRVMQMAAALAALATWSVHAPRYAYAGDKLKAVEDSHTVPASQATPSEPKSDEESAEGSHPTAATTVAGAILGALFQPSSDPKREANQELANASTASLAIEPYDPSATSIYARGNQIKRYAEASFGGFLAADAALGAHALHLHGYLGFLSLHGEWTRLYEPRAQTQTSLDLLRIQAGGNLFAGGVQRAELHMYVGALGLRGREWTPAFDMRIATRVYPIKPLVLSGSLDMAFFATGTPLITADLQAGVALSRMELRLGVRTFRQVGILSLTGPALDFSVNW